MSLPITALYALVAAVIYLVLWFRVSSLRVDAGVSSVMGATPACCSGSANTATAPSGRPLS